MTNNKWTKVVVASAFGLGVFATSSFASGPLVLGPGTAPLSPRVLVKPATMQMVQTKALETYRQLRTYWISRGIVR